jgi:hypothetical protein
MNDRSPHRGKETGKDIVAAAHGIKNKLGAESSVTLRDESDNTRKKAP